MKLKLIIGVMLGSLTLAGALPILQKFIN